VDANILSTQTQALLIGQPPEDPIDGYGNWTTFTLPASRIAVQYTTAQVNPAASPMAMPAITVSPTVRQVLAGDDPGLTKALSYGAAH
jgi:hypothetical protein